MGVVVWAAVLIVFAVLVYFGFALHLLFGFVGFVFGVWLAVDHEEIDPYDRTTF